jgi:hypothetical protein
MVVSSTYFHRSFQSARRSFIMIRKRIGPKTVPCGTPPLRICHSDTRWGILTRWLRQVRKLLIHFVINDGTPISDNLLRRMLWSIWSKALVKSNKKILTAFFDISVSFNKWWRRLNNACVVEEFFRDPNCRLSIDLLTNQLHQPVWDKTFTRFWQSAVSEMGRKSLVMSLGILFLGTGMTSAFFHTAGTDACWREALKIEVTGGASRGA